MAGLTDISPENGSAEISLIVAPRYRHSGTRYGSRTVEAILVEAFMRMRLETVYGEVYTCNTDAVVFWKTIAERLSAYTTTLPRRKFWNGKLWDSLYFSIAGDTWLPSE
jgi:RimJ/RimL family protein N-acetyltransferase